MTTPRDSRTEERSGLETGPFRLGLWAALALVLAWASAGCQGPCRSLAQEICECEANARERAACIQEIESNGNVREPTQEEDERCTELLDTCDCEALEREDFAACGLTKRREPGP